VLRIHRYELGKCNKEVLNRVQQVRKATRALYGLLWSKYISVNTKKLLFYRVTETISSYGWEIWTLYYKLKKKLLSTEMSFWRRAVRTKSNKQNN
jgi:hypothetical protein